MGNTPEEVFVKNLEKALDSYSFKPNMVGGYVSEMSPAHLERLAETMLYIINSWALNWKYNNSMFPKNVAEFGWFLMEGVEKWQTQAEYPVSSIMKVRHEFLQGLAEAERREREQGLGS